MKKETKTNILIITFLIAMAVVLLTRAYERPFQGEEKSKGNEWIEERQKMTTDEQVREMMVELEQEELKHAQAKPQQVTEGVIREVTAYNAGDINQCSGDPCISHNGENICEALKQGYKRCAANFVPMGTNLFIDGYGECKVTDRLNSRYKNRVDIAMSLEEKERALKFGIQNLKVKIIE